MTKYTGKIKCKKQKNYDKTQKEIHGTGKWEIKDRVKRAALKMAMINQQN